LEWFEDLVVTLTDEDGRRSRPGRPDED